jgi:hypothetical protein
MSEPSGRDRAARIWTGFSAQIGVASSELLHKTHVKTGVYAGVRSTSKSKEMQRRKSNDATVSADS